MNTRYPIWRGNAIGKTKKNTKNILSMVNRSNIHEIVVPKGAEKGCGMASLKKDVPESSEKLKMTSTIYSGNHMSLN